MPSRRRFLEVVAATGGACVVGGCSQAFATGQSPAHGPIAAGNVRDVTVGHFDFVGGNPVVLARDSQGLFAMSAICTHQQCNMHNDGGIDGNGLHCDCHGSSFDKSGAPTGGPARRTLDHYAVDLAADGSITVQASNLVSPSARTPVP